MEAQSVLQSLNVRHALNEEETTINVSCSHDGMAIIVDTMSSTKDFHISRTQVAELIAMLTKCLAET